MKCKKIVNEKKVRTKKTKIDNPKNEACKYLPSECKLFRIVHAGDEPGFPLSLFLSPEIFISFLQRGVK